jgi:hypothetical protein
MMRNHFQSQSLLIIMKPWKEMEIQSKLRRAKVLIVKALDRTCLAMVGERFNNEGGDYLSKMAEARTSGLGAKMKYI